VVIACDPRTQGAVAIKYDGIRRSPGPSSATVMLFLSNRYDKTHADGDSPQRGGRRRRAPLLVHEKGCPAHPHRSGRDELYTVLTMARPAARREDRQGPLRRALVRAVWPRRSRDGKFMFRAGRVTTCCG